MGPTVKEPPASVLHQKWQRARISCQSAKGRRNHSREFKAKVALEAAKDESMIVELSRKYDVHVNQIRAWKRQLLDGAVDVFESGMESAKIRRRS